MRHQIPSATSNGSWGFLQDHPKVPLPKHTQKVVGAMLDFSISALEAVETELLWNLSSSVTKEVRALLYLYFALNEASDPEAALGTLISVFRKTRTGLADEKGKMEIIQTDPSFGSDYAGYVAQSLMGEMGPIHLRFQKLTDSSIMFGAPFHANLLVHEATHRYAKTVDAPVNVPSEGKKLAYLNVFRENVLSTFKAAKEDKAKLRQKIAGKVMSHITHADALNNADSYAWFMTAMLESYDTTLNAAFKFSRMKNELRAAAEQFAEVQQQVLGDDMFGVATVFTVA
ncbi:hypothetical protein NR798_23070 [Archangium gephyra]|uniref:hypothetical protein n=1 Tax=Archangium gephyra TaxID=48 RepID=UPI0035D3E61E